MRPTFRKPALTGAAGRPGFAKPSEGQGGEARPRRRFAPLVPGVRRTVRPPGAVGDAPGGVRRLIGWLIPILILLFPRPGAGVDQGLPTRQLSGPATVEYQTDFVVAVPLETWETFLAHPLLMARLWNVYSFQPAYEVKDQKEGVLVLDPSGIRGTLTLTECRPTGRCLYGQGAVDHWAIPSFISAEGLFCFRYAGEDRQVRGVFAASMRGDNKTTDLLMKLFRGKVKSLLRRRFVNNLEDMKKIVADIVHNPERVRGRLAGGDLEEFDKAFPPRKGTGNR
ncbi:MAG: hypothetical protein QM278_11550 [Pseudomonadota bacterium]|nr:hypothetical protein [Pseudomonadota bacterium]